MEKSEFKVSNKNGIFSFTFPKKNLLKHFIKSFYEEDYSSLSFFIENYQGSNTYYGKTYWEKHKINFEEGDKEDTYIFSSDNMDFILNDSIDTIIIKILQKGEKHPKAECDFIQIFADGRLKITSKDKNILYHCMALHFEDTLLLDFSQKYQRKEFADLLKTFMPKNEDFTCHLFAKTLKVKSGLLFSLSIEQKDESLLYNISFSSCKWNALKIDNDKACETIKNYRTKEKINANFVALFAAAILIGLLYIYKSVFSVKLHLNLPVITLAIILFLSLLKFISRKVKVIYGFKSACKTK